MCKYMRERVQGEHRSLLEMYTWNSILFIIAIESNRTTHTPHSVCVCASISDEEDDEERRADGERRREWESKWRESDTLIKISISFRSFPSHSFCKSFLPDFSAHSLTVALSLSLLWWLFICCCTRLTYTQSAMSSESRILSEFSPSFLFYFRLNTVIQSLCRSNILMLSFSMCLVPFFYSVFSLFLGCFEFPFHSREINNSNLK